MKLRLRINPLVFIKAVQGLLFDHPLGHLIPQKRTVRRGGKVHTQIYYVDPNKGKEPKPKQEARALLPLKQRPAAVQEGLGLETLSPSKPTEPQDAREARSLEELENPPPGGVLIHREERTTPLGATIVTHTRLVRPEEVPEDQRERSYFPLYVRREHSKTTPQGEVTRWEEYGGARSVLDALDYAPAVRGGGAEGEYLGYAAEVARQSDALKAVREDLKAQAQEAQRLVQGLREAGNEELKALNQRYEKRVKALSRRGEPDPAKLEAANQEREGEVARLKELYRPALDQAKRLAEHLEQRVRAATDYLADVNNGRRPLQDPEEMREALERLAGEMPTGPRVGETRSVGGTTYRLNENYRWERLEEPPAAPTPVSEPEPEPQPEPEPEAAPEPTPEPAPGSGPEPERYVSPEEKRMQAESMSAEFGGFKVRGSDIPYSSALAAHQGTSWTPEHRAYLHQQDWVNHFRALIEEFAPRAKTPEQQKALEEALNKIAQKRRGLVLAYLGARSRLVSSFIAGRSKFPAAAMEKRNRTVDNRYADLQEFDAKARKLLNKVLKEAGQEDMSEVQRYEAKIAQLERRREMMKQINAAIRRAKGQPTPELEAEFAKHGLSSGVMHQLLKPDFAGRVGFADYELSNLGAEIRRAKQMLEVARAKEADARRQAEQGVPDSRREKGVEVIEDAADDRLRLVFPGKPSAQVIAALKSRGFRWSPSNGAWQRQLTNAARQAAQEVLKLLPDAGSDKPAR